LTLKLLENLLLQMQLKVVAGSGAVERAQLPAGVAQHLHPPPPSPLDAAVKVKVEALFSPKSEAGIG
jgi:hypothetical protein